MNDVDLMDQMGQDAAAINAPSDDKLFRVRELAEEQLALERKIHNTEEILGLAKDRLHEMRTKTLPDAMREIGLSSFTMTDGSEVSIDKMYFASIPSDDVIEKAKTPEEADALRMRRVDALRWLRDKGHGDLIKNTFRVVFGKGQDKAADALTKTLNTRRLEYTRNEGVHPMTLRAFVREQIEKGRTIASDLLGATVLDMAKITPKKEKKQK
jgi:hypothetical protein